MTFRFADCAWLPVVLTLAGPSPAPRPPFYNPLGAYNARLVLFYDALYLPASQRGVRTQQTHLLYQGHHYLLQQRYYNPQGLLDSCLTYDLAQTGDSLTSYLHVNAHYHSQQYPDSLVSRVQERWTDYEPLTPAAKRYVGRSTRYLAGTLPPAEPLLGRRGALPRTGTFRQGTKTDTATWRWAPEPLTGHLVFSFSAQGKHTSQGAYGWQATLDVPAQTLTYAGGGGGGSWRYVRQYLNGGPAYREHCHSSSAIVGTGGGTSTSQVYTRTTTWQAGLCQREHFVVTDVLLAGVHPEFDIVHTYAFYRGARKGRH
jgi:hypothetical protein